MLNCHIVTKKRAVEAIPRSKKRQQLRFRGASDDTEERAGQEGRASSLTGSPVANTSPMQSPTGSRAASPPPIQSPAFRTNPTLDTETPSGPALDPGRVISEERSPSPLRTRKRWNGIKVEIAGTSDSTSTINTVVSKLQEITLGERIDDLSFDGGGSGSLALVDEDDSESKNGDDNEAIER
jgi:hypothetical protein